MQPASERYMDDNNNNYGRLFAADAGITTSSSVNLTRSTCHAAYYSGSLIQLVNNYPQTFTGYSWDFVN